LGLTVGFLFLEETHQDKRDRADIGLKIGRQILRALPCIGSQTDESEETEEARRRANDEKGDYLAIPTSPQMNATRPSSIDESATLMSEKTPTEQVREQAVEPKVSFYRSLTKQIKLIIVSYGLLALWVLFHPT